MDSPYIKQTVCKVLNIFQHGKYLVAYVLKTIWYVGNYDKNLESSCTCYFILSSEIYAYQKQIKVISITSEMI